EDRRHREEALELLVRLDLVDPGTTVGAHDVVAGEHLALTLQAFAVLRHPRDGPHHRLAQQILGSCSPMGRSTTRSAPKPVRADTIPGWSATHSPTTTAPAPAGWARIAASTSSASSGATNATSLPSLATCSGSRPRREQASATISGIGRARSSRAMPTPEDEA